MSLFHLKNYQNSTAVPLHLQTLGLEKELFDKSLTETLSTLSLNPSDRIYKHPSDYISHSHHGSVWGNRPQLPKTWVILEETAHNCPLTPTSPTHTPLCGGPHGPHLFELSQILPSQPRRIGGEELLPEFSLQSLPSGDLRPTRLSIPFQSCPPPKFCITHQIHTRDRDFLVISNLGSPEELLHIP